MFDIHLAVIFMTVGLGLGATIIILFDAFLNKSSKKGVPSPHAYEAPDPPDWFRPKINVSSAGDKQQKLARYETRRWFYWRFFYAEMMERYSKSYRNEPIFDVRDLNQYGVLHDGLIGRLDDAGCMTWAEYTNGARMREYHEAI